MSDNPTASVIINNYNYGRFLGDAIESALAQTYQDAEVIVVDDGSTDESREVIQRYGDRVSSVFKENGGQASAYNAGFAASRSDVACFLDADDTLFETAIAQAVAAFEDPQIIKVEWQLQVVDARGTPTGKLVPEKSPPQGDLRELAISTGPIYDWWFTPPSSGNCYSRDFLKQVLPAPEEPYRHGADVYLTILAPLYGEICRLASPQGTYRIHEQNNYFGRQLDANRLRDYIQRFDDCCVQLQAHLAQQGVEVDINNWKKRNFNYLWPTRLLQAKADLQSVLRPGDTYILVDDDEWGDEQTIGRCHAVPFTERGGGAWGRPTDDKSAIAALERHARDGAKCIVFWWTCFWWLEHYEGFKRHLYSQCRCVLENDRLIVFELVERAPVPGTTEAMQAI
jgi:glycosyltransferase involved in cell wall biosynthesis